MASTTTGPIPARPRCHHGLHLLLLADGRIVARTGARTSQFSVTIPALAREVIGLCDGSRTTAEIAAALAARHNAQAVLGLLNTLARAGIFDPTSPPAAGVGGGAAGALSRRRVALLGNRRMLGALDAAFAATALQSRRTLRVGSFASCEAPGFLAQQAQRILSRPVTGNLAPAGAYEPLEHATEEAIRDLLAGADFAVCALEGVPHQALFEVSRAALAAGTPCLFVTVSEHQALLGPTVTRGPGPCFHCRVLATDALAAIAPEMLPLVDTPLADGALDAFLLQAAAAAVDEACAALRTPPAPERVNSLLVLEQGAPPRRDPLLAVAACPDCADSQAAPETDLERCAWALTAEEITQLWQSTPVAPWSGEADAYRRVAVVGGGTAGYMTALALRAAHPQLEVTVIESSRIPVIGVGEATTPELVRMLHAPRFLGLDVADFHRRVLPTFKLGIRFQWGAPAPYDFPFPFQRGRLLESRVYEASLYEQSLGAMLMARDAIPIFQANPAVAPSSLLHRVRWAYHLDNRRFVAYLQEQARAAGVHHVDAVVAEVERDEDGESIVGLRMQDGRRIESDLWIDCSGFRSLLMEQHLKSPFIDYASTLFTDMAIAADVPHDGVVKSYTHAQTMDAGWCWTIPFQDADHKGYVFSSAFLDEERALEEMRAANPRLENPWTVRFRSGRHADFWKGNVVALGNAYGFVEPLESTALHMLVLQIELLTTHFPPSRRDQSFKAALNRKVGERWDALRWFLGIHYRFNQARDTAFWRAANAETDVSGAEQRVALFTELAPMSYRPSHHYRLLPPEFFSDDHAFDSMLMGLKVPFKRVQTVEDRSTWARRHAALRMSADTALPQADALRWLREEGRNVLGGLTERADSWVSYWYPA